MRLWKTFKSYDTSISISGLNVMSFVSYYFGKFLSFIMLLM